MDVRRIMPFMMQWRTHRWMHRILAMVLIALLESVAGAAAAAPEAELWERWTVHDAGATATIDHSEWSAFLSRYLTVRDSAPNRMAYDQVSAADKKRLDDYLSSLSAVSISRYSRDEQRAYWINLYNALTVHVVLEHYPVESIRDISISPGFFSVGPWGKKLISVEGEQLSLDDIEHRILRPIWKDPRIHYAVNCASLGCPSLMAQAFTASNTDELLDRGAKGFINSSHGARFDDSNRLTVSSIYDWYQEDFGGNEAGVVAHLRAYALAPLAAKLATVDQVYDYDYDWSLNGTAPTEKQEQPRVGSAQR